jgi:PAS domain S-box-containing protein
MTTPGASIPTPRELGLDVLTRIPELSLDGIVVIDESGRYVYVNPAASRIFGYDPNALIGQDFTIVVAPYERERLLAGFQRSLSGSTGRHSVLLQRPDGVEREIEYTDGEFTIAGRRMITAIIRDVTDARRREREATVLARIAASLTLNEPLEDILDTIARSVVDATRAESCALALIEGAGAQRRLRVYSSWGLPAGFAAAMVDIWRVAGSVVPIKALESQQIQVAHDARQRMLAHPSYAAVHELLAGVPWDTTVVVPLVARGKSLGVLIVYYPALGPPDSDIGLLAAIADQAALTVESQRLYVEVQRKAALEERQRLARDLHDSVSQALYGIGLGARTAKALLKQNPAKAIEPVEYVLQLAQAGLTEMRALIFELRPESLEMEGLVAALERQAASVQARHGIEVNADLCDEPAIPLAVKEAVYRIAQEALHNTVKHARATRIDLQLDCDDEIRFSFADNGTGFDPHGSFPGHLGLKSMRERAEHFGGTIDIASTPSGGTQIIGRIPREVFHSS